MADTGVSAPTLRLVSNRRGTNERIREREPEPAGWEIRVRSFRSYLFERGLSDNTIRAYADAVRRAEQYLEGRRLTLPDVRASELVEYARTLPQTRDSLMILRNALRRYFAMLGRPDSALDAIRIPRKKRMVCRALDDNEAAALARVARGWGGPEGLAVLFGLYMGLRRSEIAKVRLDDVDEGGWLSIMGKGDLPAVLPLHPVIVAELARRTFDGPWVFPGAGGCGHASPATIWNYVRRVSEAAGLEGVTTHRLRHTCLATANDVTEDLRAVQDFARHARPETTAGYTRSTAKRLLQVIAALDYGDS
jgi:integrase